MEIEDGAYPLVTSILTTVNLEGTCCRCRFGDAPLSQRNFCGFGVDFPQLYGIA